MKKINEVEIDSNTFELINDLRCPRQLYRLNNKDQYALALLDRPNRIFKFESEVLTELLNDLGGGVRDVTLIEPKEPEFGTCSEAGFEIHLYLHITKQRNKMTTNEESPTPPSKASCSLETLKTQ